MMDEKVYLKFTDGREAFIYKTEKIDVGKELKKLQHENLLLKEKFKATNKGLIKVLEKRKKWKTKSEKQRKVLKNLEKWLDEKSFEICRDMGNTQAVYQSVYDKLQELKEDHQGPIAIYNSKARALAVLDEI